jgi:DNA topoisomerase-3
MEKPSAGRNAASALGGSSGSYKGESYIIASARGHLYEYVDPAKMVSPDLAEKYAKWDLENLPWNLEEFSWKLEPIKDTSQVRKDIVSAFSGCDEVVIATDNDPTGEGDAIAIRALLELGLTGKKYSRMYFTDESKPSLQKAFETRQAVPSLQDHPAFQKAIYRSAWDFASMQWTRIATAMARSSGKDSMLRQGRLKSAMITLVGDQLKAYNDYVKKPFFQNRFRDENGVVYTNPEEPRFDAKNQVPNAYATSPVVLDGKADKTTAPPRLLDLAGLSTVMAKQGLKPAYVLKVYQAGYDRGYFSYPRTEDKTITPEQFNEMSPLVDQIAGVVGVDTSLLSHREPRKTHVKPQGAHGANRPGLKVPSSLAALDSEIGKGAGAIYEVLAKNYLAMLADDYRYEQQKGHVEKYPDFLGVANVPQSMGWKSVFDPEAGDDDAADENESTKGLGTSADPFIHEGANKRPEHPSMKWLMKQLEKRDVGTGATRTSTYAEVTSEKSKYPLLVDKRNKLTLAEAGELSWRLLPGTRIGDLGLTEKVYKDMRDIAEGKARGDELLAQIADWVREDIATMTKNAATMRSELGLTEGQVERKERAEGTWVKNGKPVRFSRVWSGHRFTDEEVTRLLDGEEIEFEATAKSGKTFVVYGVLSEGTYQGRKYVGFVKNGFGQRDADGNTLPPKEWCKHVFTASEISALMAGEAVEAQDFVSKKGNTFGVKVYFKEEKPGEGKRIVPDFDAGTDAPPKTFAKRSFSDAELKKLVAGESLKLDGFTSKKGKPFSATVKWAKEGDRKKLVMSFDD